MSRKEEDKARHEYTLMEIRMSAEDVKEFVRDEVGKLEKRVIKLEHWRTFLAGAWAMLLFLFGIKGKHG